LFPLDVYPTFLQIILENFSEGVSLGIFMGSFISSALTNPYAPNSFSNECES